MAFSPVAPAVAQRTALDGANEFRVLEDEVFTPDRAVGSHARIQGHDAWEEPGAQLGLPGIAMAWLPRGGAISGIKLAYDDG